MFLIDKYQQYYYDGQFEVCRRLLALLLFGISVRLVQSHIPKIITVDSACLECCFLSMVISHQHRRSRAPRYRDSLPRKCDIYNSVSSRRGEYKFIGYIEVCCNAQVRFVHPGFKRVLNNDHETFIGFAVPELLHRPTTLEGLSIDV